MLDRDVLQDEIDKLEAEGTTWEVVRKLEPLYVARANLDGLGDAACDGGESEFMRACAGLPYRDVMRVVDAHMDAIKLVCPKEHEQVVARIRALK
jgi:hypothetical protein